jgi:hypothetical protein
MKCNYISIYSVWGRGACRFVVGKPEGKRALGKPGRRCENNFKMIL